MNEGDPHADSEIPANPEKRPGPEQEGTTFSRENAGDVLRIQRLEGKFKANIVDMGGKLKPGGKIATASGVTDGPFVETKEVIGGYMVVVAESYEGALQIAKEGPGMMMPGSSIEIREIATP